MFLFSLIVHCLSNYLIYHYRVLFMVYFSIVPNLLSLKWMLQTQFLDHQMFESQVFSGNKDKLDLSRTWHKICYCSYLHKSKNAFSLMIITWLGQFSYFFSFLLTCCWVVKRLDIYSLTCLFFVVLFKKILIKKMRLNY